MSVKIIEDLDPKKEEKKSTEKEKLSGRFVEDLGLGPVSQEFRTQKEKKEDLAEED